MILLLIPIQTYAAKVWQTGYADGFLSYPLLYPDELLHTFYMGQMWFVLYLFVIFLAAFPIMYFWTKSKKTSIVEKIPVWALCLSFLLPYLLLPIGNPGGDLSLGRYSPYFILGFLVLSNTHVQDRLVTWRRPLLFTALILLFLYMMLMFSYMQGEVSGFFPDSPVPLFPAE